VFIKQLRFYRGQQADLPLLKFFVPNELTDELADIPNTVTTGIESIAADGNEIKLSDGVKILFQSDQLSLGLLTGGGISWIRFVGQSGFLREYSSGDVLVFPVESFEGLFSAIGLAKIADAAITILDISQYAGGSTELLEPVRKYLGAVAIADSNLVCNVGAGQFLDIVKAFDSDKDVWSLYSEIDNDDMLQYYFAKGTKERFTNERADIVETFLANLRRRHGLYFKK
jgi:hypothetical protein